MRAEHVPDVLNTFAFLQIPMYSSELKPATAECFEFFYELYMHPQVNRYLLYDILEPAALQTIYEDLLRAKVLYQYIEDGIAVGMCKLILEEHRNSHAIYLGGVAIHPVHAGRGCGSRMMEATKAFAIQHKRIRIELSVASENLRALALYEKAGFQKEGVMRKYTWLKHTNEYLDEIMMAWVK